MYGDYKPPPGPPPAYLASNNPYRQSQPSSSNSADPPAYRPPPGPPPQWTGDKKPHSQSDSFDPPPGPPPGHSSNDADEPPPYNPWMAIPDNSLLPPPPAIKEDFSPANNASACDAARAEAWCRTNPLWRPRQWQHQALSQIASHDISMVPPPGEKRISVTPLRPGIVKLQCPSRQGDTTVLSTLPLHTALHSPLNPGQTQTIYFEVTIKHMSGSDATVALGFLAPPFPPNRLPGWHRGSLGVHNDDGRRYVNDDAGGRDFVRPFGKRETVGLGMRFSAPVYSDQKPKVYVFFTRNGHEEAGWDLHELRDAEAQEGGVDGLDGTADLYAAVGVCAGVELEVKF